MRLYHLLIFIPFVLLLSSVSGLETNSKSEHVYRDSSGNVYRVYEHHIECSESLMALGAGDFIKVKFFKETFLSIHEAYNGRIFIKAYGEDLKTFMWELEPELERMVQVDLPISDFTKKNQLIQVI